MLSFVRELSQKESISHGQGDEQWKEGGGELLDAGEPVDEEQDEEDEEHGEVFSRSLSGFCFMYGSNKQDGQWESPEHVVVVRRRGMVGGEPEEEQEDSEQAGDGENKAVQPARPLFGADVFDGDEQDNKAKDTKDKQRGGKEVYGIGDRFVFEYGFCGFHQRSGIAGFDNHSFGGAFIDVFRQKLVFFIIRLTIDGCTKGEVYSQASPGVLIKILSDELAKTIVGIDKIVVVNKGCSKSFLQNISNFRSTVVEKIIVSVLFVFRSRINP